MTATTVGAAATSTAMFAAMLEGYTVKTLQELMIAAYLAGDRDGQQSIQRVGQPGGPSMIHKDRRPPSGLAIMAFFLGGVTVGAYMMHSFLSHPTKARVVLDLLPFVLLALVLLASLLARRSGNTDRPK